MGISNAERCSRWVLSVMERLGTQAETTANGGTNPGSADTLTQHTDSMQNMDNNNDRSLVIRAVNEPLRSFTVNSARRRPLKRPLLSPYVMSFARS